MQIECPHCDKTNQIDTDEIIKCGECKETFSGFVFRHVKKPLMKATTAALIFGVGGYKLGDIDKNSHRYPLKIEHQIIQLCMSSSKRPISRAIYQDKEEICLCALDKASREIESRDLKDSLPEFLDIFEEKARGCGL